MGLAGSSRCSRLVPIFPCFTPRLALVSWVFAQSVRARAAVHAHLCRFAQANTTLRLGYIDAASQRLEILLKVNLGICELVSPHK